MNRVFQLNIEYMNSRQITIRVALLFLVLFHIQITLSQDFSVKRNNDSISVEIFHPLQGYTYNKYTQTDSSLIISTTLKKIDLIIADFKRDRRFFFNFQDTPERINIHPQETIGGEPGIFSINLLHTRDTCTLRTNHECILSQIISPTGICPTEEIVFKDSIFLKPGQFYLFKIKPEKVMELSLHLQLKQNHSTIEEKECMLSFRKATIQLESFITGVSTSKFSKEITYSIKTSQPIISPLSLEILIHVVENNKPGIIRDHVTLEKGIKQIDIKLSKKYKGRLPRNFDIEAIDIMYPDSIEESFYQIKVLQI